MDSLIFPGSDFGSGTALNTDATFATLAVNAPSGTQSLMFWFFSVQDGKGERIVEVQAFVPEPSAFTLALLGSLGLVQRRQQ